MDLAANGQSTAAAQRRFVTAIAAAEDKPEMVFKAETPSSLAQGSDEGELNQRCGTSTAVSVACDG